MINTHAMYIEKLNPEYKRVFRQVSSYVQSGSFDEMKTEEILSEVMDSFLSAQEEGREVSSVTGSDIKTFCEGLCSDIGIKSRMLYFLEVITPVIVIFAMFCMFDLMDFLDLESGEVSFFEFRGKESIWGYLLGGTLFFLIHSIGNFVTRKMIFKSPDKYKKISFIARVAALIAVVGVVLICFHDEEDEGMPLWIAMLFCIVYFIVYRIVTRKSREYKKAYKISMSELAGSSSSVQSYVEKTEMDRFEKKRKKHSDLTFEEFLDNEERECNTWDKKPLFYIVLVIASTILGFWFTFFYGGFEGVADGFIFIGLLLVVESVLMHGLYKITRTGTDERLQWIESKRQNKSAEQINSKL